MQQTQSQSQSRPLDLTFHAHPQYLSGSASSIDAFELRAARRALFNLKTLLCGQPMLDLIQAQILQSDKYFHSITEKSQNEWKECRVEIHVDSERQGYHGLPKGHDDGNRPRSGSRQYIRRQEQSCAHVGAKGTSRPLSTARGRRRNRRGHWRAHGPPPHPRLGSSRRTGLVDGIW